MEVIRFIDQLFEEYPPETLMALFGVVVTLLLFSLIGRILRHLFGMQLVDAGQEADQGQATATLVAALVKALVTESGHLRETIDTVLRETLQVGHHNADALSDLANQTEAIPTELLALLKPEFEYLHHEMNQTEARIIEKLTDVAYPERTLGDAERSLDIQVNHEPETLAENGQSS